MTTLVWIVIGFATVVAAVNTWVLISEDRATRDGTMRIPGPTDATCGTCGEPWANDIERTCRHGCCTDLVCRCCGDIHGGWGPAGCDCCEEAE